MSRSCSIGANRDVRAVFLDQVRRPLNDQVREEAARFFNTNKANLNQVSFKVFIAKKLIDANMGDRLKFVFEICFKQSATGVIQDGSTTFSPVNYAVEQRKLQAIKAIFDDSNLAQIPAQQLKGALICVLERGSDFDLVDIFAKVKDRNDDLVGMVLTDAIASYNNLLGNKNALRRLIPYLQIGHFQQHLNSLLQLFVKADDQGAVATCINRLEELEQSQLLRDLIKNGNNLELAASKNRYQIISLFLNVCRTIEVDKLRRALANASSWCWNNETWKMLTNQITSNRPQPAVLAANANLPNHRVSVDDENRRLRADLAAAQRQESDKQSMIDQLNNDNRALKETVNKLAAEKQQAEGTLAVMQKAKDDLELEVTKLQKSNGALNTDVARLEAELTRVQKDNESLKSDNESIKISMAKMQAQIDALITAQAGAAAGHAKAKDAANTKKAESDDDEGYEKL